MPIQHEGDVSLRGLHQSLSPHHHQRLKHHRRLRQREVQRRRLPYGQSHALPGHGAEPEGSRSDLITPGRQCSEPVAPRGIGLAAVVVAGSGVLDHNFSTWEGIADTVAYQARERCGGGLGGKWPYKPNKCGSRQDEIAERAHGPSPWVAAAD